MPLDKLRHIAVGLLAALFGLLAWLLLVQAGAAPMSGLPGALALTTTVAGLTKEGADYLDNRARPGEHGVEPLDALATAVPGWLAGLAAALVLEAGRLPV